jgi:hypothetical protein
VGPALAASCGRPSPPPATAIFGCRNDGGPFTITVPAGTYTLNTAFAAGDDAADWAEREYQRHHHWRGRCAAIIQTDGDLLNGTKRVFDLDPNVLGNVAITISV